MSEVVPNSESATTSVSAWGREVRALAAALTFMTRLPVHRVIAHDLSDLGNAATYFPLVGVCVGAIGASVFVAALLLWTPVIAVLLSIIATVFLTGAFHEDALADSLDGFGGGWTKEQVLAIMKDSRVGSYALIGMVLAVALKIAALHAIWLHDVKDVAVPQSLAASVFSSWPVVRALVAAHVLSRWSSVWLIRAHAYVRAEDPDARASAGRPFVNSVTGAKFVIASLFTIAIVGALLGVKGLLVGPVAVVAAFLAGRYFNRRIGGITGDALGAANQVVELCVYLTLATPVVRV